MALEREEAHGSGHLATRRPVIIVRRVSGEFWMSQTVRPRRSVLYMPGANMRALEKARTLPADALIFDLEDAVAPHAKAAARTNAVLAAESKAYGKREIFIRCNGLGTPWGEADIAAIARSGADALLVPKV